VRRKLATEHLFVQVWSVFAKAAQGSFAGRACGTFPFLVNVYIIIIDHDL
jgi:hypothetical protein